MTILSNEYQSMAANAICHAASMAGEEARVSAAEYSRPSVVWKPKLFIDGHQWCALFGENLQDGVAGFGDSPATAMWDFDEAWSAKLNTPNTENSLLYRRVIVNPTSPKYPNRHGVIVGISGTEQLYAHVSIDAYGHAPARRREMFPLETLTVMPKGD